MYVGSAKTFGCFADDSEKVLWHVTPASLPIVLKTINVGGSVALRFAQRYHVNNVNLVINNVQHCDAGLFRCNILTSNGQLRTRDFLLMSVGEQFINVLVVLFCFI